MEFILAMALLISGYHNIKNNCDPYEVTVDEIGICVQSGECKIKLSNGEYDTKYLPMVGESITKYNCN